MKKAIFVLICAAAVSCKKNYTCECINSGTYPNFPQDTTHKPMGKLKKDDAEAKCNEGDKSYNSSTYTYLTECSITKTK